MEAHLEACIERDGGWVPRIGSDVGGALRILQRSAREAFPRTGELAIAAKCRDL